MAHITEFLDAPLPRERAFDHVADFTTSQDWDPGIGAARALDPGPPRLGSRFRVLLQLGPARVPLTYEITRYERPDRVVLTTRGPAHRGEDDVRFRPLGDGTRVTWDATFALRGPGLLLDPLLAVGFRRAGRAAVAGLQDALRGLSEP